MVIFNFVLRTSCFHCRSNFVDLACIKMSRFSMMHQFISTTVLRIAGPVLRSMATWKCFGRLSQNIAHSSEFGGLWFKQFAKIVRTFSKIPCSRQLVLYLYHWCDLLATSLDFCELIFYIYCMNLAICQCFSLVLLRITQHYLSRKFLIVAFV